MNCGIYEIKNILNNNCYIGSSENFEKRKNRHLNALKKDIHENSHLQRSYNKIKREQNYSDEEMSKYFIFTCIFYVEKIENKKLLKEELIRWENCYIEDYKRRGIILYNIRLKAESNLGIKYSKYYGDNIRNRQLGRKLPKEIKNKISVSMKGRKHTEETKNKISIANKGNTNGKNNLGNKHTEETKNKISMTKKGVANIFNKKRVKNLDTQEVFNSIKEASKFYGLKSQSRIGEVCKGIKKTSGGYRWSYVN